LKTEATLLKNGEDLLVSAPPPAAASVTAARSSSRTWAALLDVLKMSLPVNANIVDEFFPHFASFFNKVIFSILSWGDNCADADCATVPYCEGTIP
jgi:hypothetical protein